MREGKTKKLVMISMCTVIICICTVVSIPLTIPFTLQTFGVFFALSYLGGKRGLVSILLYIALGAIGLPVFSGFRGGFGVLFQATGGYIVGFVFIGLIYILFTKLMGERLAVKIAALAAGMIVCYAFGTLWFVIFSMRSGSPVGMFAAFCTCVLPFIIPDAAKLTLAIIISERIKKIALKKGD